MSQNGRRLPFPPSARVPIIGQVQPPKGLHFYEVPCLIQRPGEPLEADSFEFSFPMPIQGAWFKGLPKTIAQEIQRREPDRPEPNVVPLSPVSLGFVAQEMLDAQAAANAEAAEAEPQETIQ